MALHTHTPKQRKKIKKEKSKSKTKKKPLVPEGKFDPAHPASNRGVVARELRENRKKNGR